MKNKEKGEIFNFPNMLEFERIFNLEVIVGKENDILQRQNEGLRVLTLPETIGRILGANLGLNFNLFLQKYENIFRKDKDSSDIPILTSSFEVVGTDRNNVLERTDHQIKQNITQGAIIILHGVLPKDISYDSTLGLYLLDEVGFSDILSERNRYNSGVRVYSQKEMLHEVLKKENSKIRSGSVIILPEMDFFTNPGKYCYNLKLSVNTNSVKINIPLIWRTLRPANHLVRYINSIDGFEQSPPLIEPYMSVDFLDDKKFVVNRAKRKNMSPDLICNTRAGLLKKYSNYVVPLKLQYGCIVKSLPDQDELVCAFIPHGR